jgi:cell wall-associated NlpC family hydrolase
VKLHKYCRAGASKAAAAVRTVGFPVFFLAATLSGALLPAPACADPASGRPPALRPMDDRGFLDNVAGGMADVADRSHQLLHEVRDRASGLVDSAVNFLGVRYRLGGNSAEAGFDCSGFTRYVFENSIGRVLPHRADEQANSPDLVKVDKQDLKPGDLVFFDTVRRTFSHVGIYLGDGKFIHSPKTGEAVRIEDMNIAYWARRFTGARRVPELTATGGGLAAVQARAAATPVADADPGTALRLASASAVPVMSLNSDVPADALALSSRSTPGFLPQRAPLARPLGER